MLKLLFIIIRFHSTLIIILKTHKISCFVIILKGFNKFFHIIWTIIIYTSIESITLKLLKLILECCKLHLLVYILNHTQQFNVLHLYLNALMKIFTSFKLSTFAHELNHFTFVDSITHELHFALIIIFWNE